MKAPAGAPNVLLVMTDDVGFASSSTFGGAIPTPTLDQIAAHGLRFNRAVGVATQNEGTVLVGN